MEMIRLLTHVSYQQYQYIVMLRTNFVTVNDMETEPELTLLKLLPKGVKSCMDSFQISHSKKDPMHIYYLDSSINTDNEVPNTSQVYTVSQLFAKMSFPCLQFSLSRDDFASLTESLPMSYNEILDVYEYTCFQYCSNHIEGPIIMLYCHFHGGGTSIIHFDPTSHLGHSVINIQRQTDDIIQIIQKGKTGIIGQLIKTLSDSNTCIPTLFIVGESVTNIKVMFDHVEASGGFGNSKGKFNVKYLKRAFSSGIHALMNAKRIQLGMDMEQDGPETSVAMSPTQNDTEKTKCKRIRIAKDFMGKGISYGTVKGVSQDKDGIQTWFVQYDDGDSDDFTNHDLEMARFFHESLQGVKSRKKMKQVGTGVKYDDGGVNAEESLRQNPVALESIPPDDGRAA